MSKITDSIKLIQDAEKLALKYNDFGFHLAFSGGKDSQVIYELCKMAGVKFKAFFYKTSVDPKELLSFIRFNYPSVEWIKPKMSMFALIVKKKSLPQMNRRFCCEVLKERNGLNSVVITGIRKAESAKRAKRKKFEQSCKVGKDKNLLNPIIEWLDSDVYSFLADRNIPLCILYETQKRIGCIGCPMNHKNQRIDFNNRPAFKKAYTFSVQKLMDIGKYKAFENADDVISWWTSGLSCKVYLANKLQMKIKYPDL